MAKGGALPTCGPVEVSLPNQDARNALNLPPNGQKLLEKPESSVQIEEVTDGVGDENVEITLGEDGEGKEKEVNDEKEISKDIVEDPFGDVDMNDL